MLPKLYTYDEAMEYLRIKSKSTLISKIKNGEIKATPNKLISETSILKYINGE